MSVQRIAQNTKVPSFTEADFKPAGTLNIVNNVKRKAIISDATDLLVAVVLVVGLCVEVFA